MRAVFIISTGEVLGGKTAGARRILNIARSIAAGNVVVYLCSFADFQGNGVHVREICNGVFSFGTDYPGNRKKRSLIQYLRTVNSLIAGSGTENVVYLYPNIFVFRDFIYLMYFKFLKGYRFFCEINELRSSIPFSSLPPRIFLCRIAYFLKSTRDFVIYKLNELQVCLYDGIVVISTNLECYFSRLARSIIRIPILCDSDLINRESISVSFHEEVFKICFAGYIKFEKEGFDILINVLSNVNRKYSTELYLYGILNSEDNFKLEKYSNRFALSNRIFYMGNIDPEMLQDEFLKYHLLILPRTLNKRTKYGFSTKLSEYLVSGKPVLLTDVSDNALFIQDTCNGYLIPPGDIDVMTQKLFEIIENYNTQAEYIVKNAFRTVREKLDYRLFTENYIGFFFPNAPETGNDPQIN